MRPWLGDHYSKLRWANLVLWFSPVNSGACPQKHCSGTATAVIEAAINSLRRRQLPTGLFASGRPAGLRHGGTTWDKSTCAPPCSAPGFSLHTCYVLIFLSTALGTALAQMVASFITAAVIGALLGEFLIIG